MRVPVVHVGRVRVAVVQRAVVVRVAVRAGGHGVVAVQVVAIVVGVGMFVIHGLVNVVVAVVFCQVDQHPGHHEPAAREHQDCAVDVFEGQFRPDKASRLGPRQWFGERLFDESALPVCSPALLRRTRLARHSSCVFSGLAACSHDDTGRGKASNRI